MNLYGWTMMDEALRQENRGIDLFAEGEVRDESQEPQDTQDATEAEFYAAWAAAANYDWMRSIVYHSDRDWGAIFSHQDDLNMLVPDRVRPA